MKWKLIRWRYLDYAVIVCAGAIYAIALKYFVLPSRVILTGTEGIASALSYYHGNYQLFIILYLAFHSLLLLFAFVRLSRTFAFRSMIVVVTVAIFLAVLPELRLAQPEPQNERILLVIFGGLLTGTAKAIAFKSRGSTGDEDILGAYFAMKYLKPVGSISVFAAIGSTAFGLVMDYMKTGQFEATVNTLMYTCIFIFASTETLNNLYRKFKVTMVVVITKTYQDVAKAITSRLSYRTYTVQPGIGGHSGESFWMVRTVIAHDELRKLMDAIERADPDCFYYYHDIEGVSNRYYIVPIE